MEEIKTTKENQLTGITFHNQPKLSQHEVDKRFNERRLALLPFIEKYISEHKRFKGKNVEVVFAQKGISSVVCIIDTGEEKLVLKVPLSLTYASGEAQFLKVWENTGIKVPHVYEEGKMNGHSFLLMEFIDAPILCESYSDQEMIKRGIYKEMGQTLRAMHEPEAEGFGCVVDGKAEYRRFEDWIDGPDMQKRTREIEEYQLLGEEYGSFSDARRILIDFINKNPKSSDCHDDYGTHNMFATEPLTVFDSYSRFGNGIVDFGRSLQYLIAKNVPLDQFIEGYFNGEQYDKKVLHAAIFLAIYMKLPYAHKTKQVEKIKNLREYLKTNKHLLE